MGTSCFNAVQKSFMLFNLAAVSLEPAHILESVILTGSHLLDQYRKVRFDSKWSEGRCIEAL